MSRFAIKTASPADIPQIIEIQQKTWWVTYESILGKAQCDFMFEQAYSKPALLRQMEELDHRFVILLKDDVVCGFASYSHDTKGGDYKLQKIYVSPEGQGTGAGRFLLSELETLLRAEGGREMRLNVNRYNPAKTFYERMGYSVLYEEDIPIGSYWMNDYVMGKSLLAATVHRE